ncbi:MAG: hypothetical protein VXZ82_07255 [Planctomycetota bacterium]|nr:hypothetical protein [Planctomycetota bacterium]
MQPNYRFTEGRDLFRESTIYTDSHTLLCDRTIKDGSFPRITGSASWDAQSKFCIQVLVISA